MDSTELEQAMRDLEYFHHPRCLPGAWIDVLAWFLRSCFSPTVPLIEHDINTIFAFGPKHCYENKWQCLGNTTYQVPDSVFCV